MRMLIASILIGLAATSAYALETRGGAECVVDTQNDDLIDLDTGYVWGNGFQNWLGPHIEVTCPVPTQTNSGSVSARVYYEAYDSDEALYCNLITTDKFGIFNTVSPVQSGSIGGTLNSPIRSWLTFNDVSMPTFGTAIVLCDIPEFTSLGSIREI